MSVTPRAKWMASTVADSFGVSDIEAQEIFTSKQNKPKFDDFFSGVGSPRILIYYQTQYKVTESGEVKDYGGHKEFFVSDGEKIKLKGKGVYFLRSCKGALKQTAGNDENILFGEISEYSVTSLNTIINQVYKPMVDKLGKDEWLQCTDEQKKEFTHVFDGFSLELREALKSLTDNIALEPYDPQYENDVKNIHTSKSLNQNMLDDFEKIFGDWSGKIQAALDGADAEKKDDKDSHPQQELEYWKQRMRKLTGISEQLRSKNCRTVYDVLTQASQSTGDNAGKPRDKIYLATSKWRSIELRVTEHLNEAKDNVKYLQTLEKFIDPLYNGDPETIKETLPALMNSIKMIHTIARYYNTNERMTSLFVKITNQMIKRCKYMILNFRTLRGGEIKKGKECNSSEELWKSNLYPADELIPMMQSCIDLNNAYQKQYNMTKERLQKMPKGKQFEFSTNAIFGKFNLFSRRVSKLIELFGTIQQFKTLEKHNLENIKPILNMFKKCWESLQKKNNDLLDQSNNTFDRDFVEFNVEVSTVETELQLYIDDNFDNITNIEDSLKLLRKFKAILHRDNLKNSLNSKYAVLFHNYGLEINTIEDQYNKHKNNPPIVRNLPTVSGSITWSRHLFFRISGPIEQFPQDLIKQKDSKRALKNYNKIGYTLFSFEYLWREKWIKDVENAKAGLQATLIIRHPENNKLYVNFDKEILTLIREAKCITRIGIDIPESAKIVLLQEEKFKMYNNELQFVLREYDRIVNKIRPNTKSLLVPHLEDLEYKLRPGMVTLTWTSMNIDGYLNHVHVGLAKLEQLIININDIMENRIENNLKALSKTVLVNLPQDAQTFTLDDFVAMQEEWIREESEKLKSKNYEVEGAVEDLIQTICSYQLDQHVEPISAEEIQKLSKYYNWSMYQALLHATKYSLNQMKERICGRRNMPKQILKPFFEVDVHLDIDECQLKPTLDEVQSAINRAASHVLKSTKHVQNWNQKDIPEEDREPFYDWIAKDKEIVKVILLLTGSIQGTKNNVKKFLEGFEDYNWLWKKKIDEALKAFNAKKPELEDFDAKLSSFKSNEQQIMSINTTHQIGALSLKTENVKIGLKKWIDSWKDAFAKDLHKRAKNRMEELTDMIKQIKLKIEKPAKDIDSLGNIMSALEEIRKKQSDIEIEFRPVIEMCKMLENYLPEIMEKEEMDPNTILEKDWGQLVDQSVNIRNDLQGRQSGFKKDLVVGVKKLIGDVKIFRKDFEENGPMVPGIDPKEALNRLRMFSEEYSIRKRKFDTYHAGETLFGLPHQEYKELTETRKQIELLDKLYNLYSKVKDTIGKWKDITWVEIQNEIEKMTETIENFGRDCTKLPGVLKSWDAYKELKTEIEDMTTIIPLVEALAKPTIRPRHWEEVIELCKVDIPYQEESFNLQQLLEAPILQYQEDIEDITDQADKQAKLEKALNGEISEFWEEAEFVINNFKGVDKPSMLGGNILDIQEKFEEHIMALNQMNAMRYVKPFKQIVLDKIALLSECQDTVEKWLKVQNLWTNLVSVFSSKSIAQELPVESKKFKGIDKQWLKIMEKAFDTKNVVQCCVNDILKQSLPVLQEGLEVCQKKLENFLESKRGLFPRFYFISNADLLKILSMGSDPNAVQDDFEKLFDAIHRVAFDDTNRKLIVYIIALMGGIEERVYLIEPVLAEGNIEEWLGKLEREMQRSMRDQCVKGVKEVFGSQNNLKEYYMKYQSQISLLGMQTIWADQTTECLEKNKKEQAADLQKKGKKFQQMKDELVDLCLEDLDKLQRCKVETLVTIHVHQLDVFVIIAADCKANRIKDSNDFDWCKNTRCSYRREDNHIQVQVTDVTFTYSYEFLGAKERLCITALTDRCYVTLSQALGMCYGGAPAGPAGTGKTETVKDLGRTLGIFVIVNNCSPEHKYRDLAKIFKGVCQSGLWGCFDEFNRILLPTLSVVAAQVESITQAKKQNLKRFMFPNEEKPILLIKSCAYFITMNPGYAGRQALPENLKVLFRGVTMMTPDFRIIIMVKLSSVGYKTAEVLSFKFNELYALSKEQLSKQRHYDFGLRNILSVLRTAGNSKRETIQDARNKVIEKEFSEELLVCRTLRDMNLSKFVAQDIPLFLGLLKDIFPLQTNIPKKVYKTVDGAVRRLLKERNLFDEPKWYIKIIQLYENSMVRHGFMVVGSVGSGKTTIINNLTDALSEVVVSHKLIKMNPKSITGQEMYGVMNTVSGEWIPGVFSEIWKKCNDKKNKHVSWIICDGPVDTLWIENLNTVLDDNKILTLANAERIPMSDNTKMVFEVENLKNASPATVSRCGIVFVSNTDLFWRPPIYTWCKDRQSDRQYAHVDEEKWINEFTEKYIQKRVAKPSVKGEEQQYDIKHDIFNILERDYHYVMDCPHVVRITQFLNLMSAMLQKFQTTQDCDKALFEKVYVYCLAWALAGLFETEDREKFHKYLESKNAPLPQSKSQQMQVEKETIFDSQICLNTKSWKLWEAEQWTAPKRIQFSQLLIPTSDSCRADYIIDKMASLPLIRSNVRKETSQQNTLLVGSPGTAKTSVVLMYLSKFNQEVAIDKRINFSSATEPINFQDSIDAEVDKKQSKTYAPPGGKKMTVFLDDMSMPLVNQFDDQITLEITRQLIEAKGYYFLNKDDRGYFKEIQNVSLIGAMNHPGDGRNDIPPRLKRHFFSINMTPSSVRSIENIYGEILKALITPKKYSNEIVNMKQHLIDATIAIWDATKKKLLPTPSKFHYNFTIRELASVFQGICGVAQKSEYKVIQNQLKVKSKMRPELFLIALWRHECDRTFLDKLISNTDKKCFTDLLDRVTKEKFRDSLGFDDEQLMTDYLFADFMREDVVDEYGDLVEEAPFVYEACPDIETIKKICNAKLEAYNLKNASKQMNLVIFDDALKHLLRITRIINTDGGNILLVGVGGSGKQSLTKLASFITKKEFFQIALTKSYGVTHLKDDIKELYSKAGPQGKSVSFIMTDAEIKSETFLEAINSMLATGEIPGLIPKDEKDVISLECKNIFAKEIGLTKGEDPSTLTLWNFFINRVKDKLHMILAFSPVGNKFRERSQKFPSLFSQCKIDWFLPWPKEALVAVSSKFLGVFKMDCSKEIKVELESHMGKCHEIVTEVCEQYFQRMRRHVYVTPKSYLSFIDLYKDVYKKKYKLIDTEESNIVAALSQLITASQGVEDLKKDLAKEEIKLKEAQDGVEKVLKELEIENRKAKIKSDEVSIVQKGCLQQKVQIQGEKEDADRQLSKALPFLEKAVKAAASIDPAAIKELGGMSVAVDTCKVILDAIHILFQRKLDPVKIATIKMRSQNIPFIQDSYTWTKPTLKSASFLKDIQFFSEFKKDSITEETIELLEPYLTLKMPDDAAKFAGIDLFTKEVAEVSNKSLGGLCDWAAAMSDYHKASKIVKPKLKLLEVKGAELAEAQEKLGEAEAELAEVTALKERLKKTYDDAMAKKNFLEENAAKTRKKMTDANKLISSLADNKTRWTQQSNEFKSLKQRLVGDVAKACAFVSYCGPFNSEFRSLLLDQYFHEDIIAKSIPVSSDLKLTEFLVDEATVGEWNLQGLPNDPLSVQNGIMVTRSSRYPLMIDPQGQAINWIIQREPILKEQNCILTLKHPSLKDALKFPLEMGYPVLIESVENEVDPMLDPILEKQIIKKGKNRLIKIADTDMDFDEKFTLFMTSRLANPHFSPELAAKTTIIDFTVTQSGLEDQLLARLISCEQKQLEEQMVALQEDVTANTKILKDLEEQLLDRLANVQGSLLDDVEIIQVLATIKTKSKEVNEKLLEGVEKKSEIKEKREKFRPAAARGAVLYFCVVEMTLVNWMYNTSLSQFLGIFYDAIKNAAKAQIINDRVINIRTEMTWLVYRYINRGLFERDKTTFKITMGTKILIKDGKLNSLDIGMFLKAGAGIDDRNKIFVWMQDKTWLNLKALSKHKFNGDHSCFFKELPDRIQRNESIWRSFLELNEPESSPVPDYEEKIHADANIGSFMHLCLIRSLREDRTMLAANMFIQDVLTPKYTQPVNDSLASIHEVSKPNIPVLFLLSLGADPTGPIDEYAKKHKQFPTGKVSMGEEQEIPAKALINQSMAAGKWVVLNNCHLSLEFMAELETFLNPKDKEVHPDFRLWITCEPHPEFPLGLLQMAIKVTTEPPNGLQAGLSRTFNTIINQDFLERVEPYDKWRQMVYSICFMHSIVQERRKFGPLGFCIPYEFNNTDLIASMTFLEVHMTQCATLNTQYSWKAMQYMVCDVQYGGRITDSLDRELFNTYGLIWIQDQIFNPGFCFNNAVLDFSYQIPDAPEHIKFLDEINTLPQKDSPTIFGLHNNADLTYRLKQSNEMLTTLTDTQPKESGGGGGLSREDQVKENIEKNLIPSLPNDFIFLDVDDKMKTLKGPKGLGESGKYDLLPLNIFLRQELERFQFILTTVKETLNQILEAISGNIPMTGEIVESINSIYDFRVPYKFQFDPTGAEISWMTPSLGGWVKGLCDRHHQLSIWINKERPVSFWLTGFFNPQGFLTAMKQEVTRIKKSWALDDVIYQTEVLKEIISGEDGKIDNNRLVAPSEGVLIHGLFLEGAGWHKVERKLEDSQPKELYYQFPIIHVTAIEVKRDAKQDNKPKAGKIDLATMQKTYYSCPVYMYPKRNDKYLIFRVYLKPEGQGAPPNPNKGTTAAMKWKLAGVVLLCCKD